MERFSLHFHRSFLSKASDEEKVTGAGFEPVTAATAVKKLVTKLQMLISYRTSNHNIDTVAPLPVAAEPRLPLPFGTGHVLPLPLTGPLRPIADATRGTDVAATKLPKAPMLPMRQPTPTPENMAWESSMHLAIPGEGVVADFIISIKTLT